MSGGLKKQKLVITNNKRLNYRQQSYSYQEEESSLPAIQRQLSNSRAHQAELNDRLAKLQGNLKLLEKKYRENLKEGFENKIKAYRLEAVFERKLLKNAIREIQKQNQITQIKKKWSHSEKKNEPFNTRIEAMKVERYQRNQHFREKKLRERASYSLCLHENRDEMRTIAKQSHDKILEEEENVNKKKNYFTFLRKSTQKKEEESQKQELLEKIFHNTQKLKEAKETLTLLKYNQQKEDRNKTFVTI